MSIYNREKRTRPPTVKLEGATSLDEGLNPGQKQAAEDRQPKQATDQLIADCDAFIDDIILASELPTLLTTDSNDL